MITKRKGGKRQGSGRKPVADKKEQIVLSIYRLSSEKKMLRGKYFKAMEELKLTVLQSFNEGIDNILKNN